MKKIMYTFILVILLFCVSACKPTPDKDIVKSKGDLEQEIADKTVSIQDFEIDNSNNIEKSGENNMWKEQYIDEKQVFQVDINAVVEIPNSDEFPVVKIDVVQFDDNDLQNVVNVFFANNVIYDGNLPSTKEQLAQEIVKAKAAIENAKNTGWNGTMVSEEYIDQLEELYQNAPEDIQFTPIEPEWITIALTLNESILFLN